MPEFKVKDLLIGLPTDLNKICIANTTACPSPSLVQCPNHTYTTVTCFGCSWITPHCGITPVTCGITPHCGITLVTCGITPHCGITPVTCGHSIPCGGGSQTPCGGSRTPFEQPATLEEIAVLKVQLKQELQNLEEQERQVNEQLKPKTLDEATLIETKLNEALAEIKAIKDQLKKTK